MAASQNNPTTTRKPQVLHPPALPGLTVPSLLSLSPSSSIPSLHPNAACREVPASLQVALDKMQKKACQLLLEELLLDLQVCLSTAQGCWGCKEPSPARTALLLLCLFLPSL